MARSRNIKPGFFRNADLVELHFATRLLFIGLWTIADRSGRLEDRPKQIKIELFPADNVDCDEMLTSLSDIGMIERYAVGTSKYIQITNFSKHQNPHKEEKCSIYPDKDGVIEDAPPKKHHASTMQAPCNNDATSEVVGLIPDSFNLIPDTNIKDIVPSEAVNACPHEKIIELYHSVLPVMPSVKVWTEKRRKILQARWREDIARQNLDYWERLFGYIAKSDFLCGKTEKPFSCDLEWILNASNFVKIIEGKYHAGK